MTTKGLAFLASLLVTLAIPSAAGAFTIGHGFGPGLAVDAAGTAYIAWSGPENPASLQFCRLPRGATACDIARAIAAPGTTTRRAFVTVSGSRIAVVQYRYPLVAPDSPGVYEFISTDGGAHFDAGRIIGAIPIFEAVAGPGDSLSGVTDAISEGEVFQNVPLDGSGSAGLIRAQLSADHPYRGTVGLVDAATPLTVFTDGADAAQYRLYDGSGSLNDAANWTPAQDIGVARYPKLAGGPSGLFLLATAPDNTVFARKWNGTTFGSPVAVAGGADAPTLHAFQDAAGRLHAVFARGDAAGLHMIHAVSDDGTTWSSGTAMDSPLGIADTRVATAPDHVGVAVLRAGNPVGEIRVGAVGPGAPVGVTPTRPAPTAQTPRQIIRRKPSFAATGSARRAGSKVRLKISGVLRLPSGISRASGCRGTVKISIARGTKLIASKTVPVGATCKFSLTGSIKRSKVKRARRLVVKFRFSGNTVLTSLSKAGSVRVR